jgi:hypothetical protein
MNNDNWLTRNWRPLAAITYLIICIFDFIIMPTLMFMRQESVGSLLKDLNIINNLDMQKIVLDHIFMVWEPLTLKYDGMLHISFGAILGASAWKRGAEKIEKIKQATEIARINANNPTTNTSQPITIDNPS